MEPLAALPSPHRAGRALRWLLLVGATLPPLLLLFPMLNSIGAAAPRSSTLSILASDESGLLVELLSPQYFARETLASGTPFLELEVPGLEGRVTDVGYPQLPLWGGLIGVPPDRDVRVRILEVESETVPLGGDVIPVPGIDLERGAIESHVPEADLTHQDSLYPAVSALVEPVGYFRDQRLARLVLYPLRVDPARNLLEHSTRLLVRVDFVADNRALAGARVAPSPSAESLLESTLLNYDEAQTWRGLPADFQAPEPGLQVGVPAYKIEVDADGIYRVTSDDLLAAGMDLYQTDPSSLALTSQGQPVAFEWTGDTDQHFEPGEFLLFYGQEFRGTVMEEKYTDVNVYWLSEGSVPGPRMDAVTGIPTGAPAAASYRATVHLEEDLKHNSLHTDNPECPDGETWQDTWFWTKAEAGTSVTRAVTLTAKALGDYTATVRLKQYSDCMGEPDAADHRVRLELDGFLLADQVWSGDGTSHCSIHVLSGAISQTALLGDGDDEITWTVVSSTPAAEWMNWIEVSYQRRFVALEDELTFGGDITGTWTYTLTGFATSAVTIWDITSPLTPRRILSPAVSGTGPYTAVFQSEHDAGANFIAAGADGVRAPLAVTRYVPPDLEPPGGADWMAITHPDFLPEVQRLADYRTSRGLRAVVVDVNDIYNQYGAGIYQPAAIRDYLAHALTWSDRAPGYALLVGDGNWNFRGVPDCYYYRNYVVCYPEPNYIPPYLAIVDPVQGEVPADNQYAMLVGDDALPDIALGRLPVRTLTETGLVVDKIIQHESQLLDPSPWRQDVVFVADKYDGEYDFHNQADVVAELLPPDFHPVKIYYMESPYTSTEVTEQAVLDAFGRGASLVNYRGHGAITVWGKDGILYAAASVEMTNSERLPVVLSMDCLDSYFAFPAEAGVSTASWQAISEVMLRRAGGGSVGHWGAAGLGIPLQHSTLHRGFIEALFYGGQSRFGDAAVAAKLYFASSTWPADYLLHTFTLLGDPAMHVLPFEKSFLPLILGGG